MSIHRKELAVTSADEIPEESHEPAVENGPQTWRAKENKSNQASICLSTEGRAVLLGTTETVGKSQQSVRVHADGHPKTREGMGRVEPK